MSQTSATPPPAQRAQDDDYDPFDDFNRAQGAGQVDDPYPMFAELRRRGPIAPVDLGAMFRGGSAGDAEPEAPADPAAPTVYTAASFEAVSEVLRDASRFSSRGYANTMGAVMGHSILEMDPPEHGVHRGLVQQAFSRRNLERWEHELVRPVIDALIGGFAERGRADLVRELTFPFPVHVIAGMIGIPEEDHADFHRWAVELISVQVDMERGMKASDRLRDLFARLLAERRVRPQRDLLTLLAEAEIDGERLDDEALLHETLLILIGGDETTRHVISGGMEALIRHPDARRALEDGPGRIPVAVEEMLRWVSPIANMNRTATRDVELGGHEIREGDRLLLIYPSANRDARAFDAPDTFDPARDPNPHLAFGGFGAHFCLGASLARLELRVMFEELLRGLPPLELTTDAPLPRTPSNFIPGIRAMPVRTTDEG